ncbi:unnamed protein product [Spirodela intermedia]|uniref:Uncharacterized protein n=1 Tax=Spirodela intermedia TaxID=51605 RepID=A0A7I8IMW3_SPIIN|nr:unnamed protein product [Spirodela intermedia]CAA6659316.1 unnamed protein product [Spirodela intermedia]
MVLLASHRKKRPPPPPGPRPWPIVGSLHLIGELPHRSIHELFRNYGPIMQLYLGSQRVVVGSSVEMATEFLKKQDLVFASRPRTAAGKYTTYNYSDIAWARTGRTGGRRGGCASRSLIRQALGFLRIHQCGGDSADAGVLRFY